MKKSELNETIREMKKIDVLSQIEGLSVEEMLENSLFDGTSPAICMNKKCDYTTEMEPDQDQGYCEDCQTNTVKSISILMGVI